METRSFIVLHDDYTTINELRFTLLKFPEKPESLGNVLFTSEQFHNSIIEIAVGKALADLTKLMGSSERGGGKDKQEEDNKEQKE